MKMMKIKKLLLDTLGVLIGAGVDLDALAFFNKQRHTHLHTRLDGSVLHGVGGGVAGKTRLGVGDDSFDEGGQFADEGGLGVGLDGDLDILTVLQELGSVDDGLGDVNLLVGLGVHENVHIALFIEVGVGATLDADDVNLGAAGECVLEDTAGLDAAHFGADKGGTLAGFYMKELYDGVDVVVEINTESVLDISGCCHII